MINNEMPGVGQPAPAFTLPATEPEEISLSDFRGKHVILAFYALDFTGGWQAEVDAFQRDHARFEAASAQVLGVSVDSVPAHRAWAEQLGGLAYPLLADFHPKGAVAQQFGVWNEDHGVSKRAVFIIDRDGIIRWSKLYERELPDNDEILSALHDISPS